MYKRNNKDYIQSGDFSPSIFIENNDYANSELLTKLDLFTEYEKFTITKNEHLLDLISEEIYGDKKYSWIIMYINRISLDELVRHRTLNVIPIDKLKIIIGTV
jgi:hypothetical protein